MLSQAIESFTSQFALLTVPVVAAKEEYIEQQYYTVLPFEP